MPDKITVDHKAEVLGCDKPCNNYTIRCDQAGKIYYLSAPSAVSAKDVVCRLAPKCKVCGHGHTEQNLVVYPLGEALLIPTSDTIYAHEQVTSAF